MLFGHTFYLYPKLQLLQFDNCTWPYCYFSNILIKCAPLICNRPKLGESAFGTCYGIHFLFAPIFSCEKKEGKKWSEQQGSSNVDLVLWQSTVIVEFNISKITGYTGHFKVINNFLLIILVNPRHFLPVPPRSWVFFFCVCVCDVMLYSLV